MKAGKNREEMITSGNNSLRLSSHPMKVDPLSNTDYCSLGARFDAQDTIQLVFAPVPKPPLQPPFPNFSKGRIDISSVKNVRPLFRHDQLPAYYTQIGEQGEQGIVENWRTGGGA